DQADLAARFAAKGVDRFAPPTRWSYGLDGTPALEGVAARLVCRRYDTQLIGDHWLVVGRVVHSAVHDAFRPPFLYHRRSFCRLGSLVVFPARSRRAAPSSAPPLHVLALARPSPKDLLFQ